jgi:hypothetical protein
LAQQLPGNRRPAVLKITRHKNHVVPFAWMDCFTFFRQRVYNLRQQTIYSRRLIELALDQGTFHKIIPLAALSASGLVRRDGSIEPITPKLHRKGAYYETWDGHRQLTGFEL